MPFQPGNKIAKGGRPDKAFTDALRLAVNQVDKKGTRKLRLIADQLVTQALAGESWAIQQVVDRLDGKPAQESTMTILRDVNELTDSEIAARIAELRGIGATDGDETPPVNPSQLN